MRVTKTIDLQFCFDRLSHLLYVYRHPNTVQGMFGMSETMELLEQHLPKIGKRNKFENPYPRKSMIYSVQAKPMKEISIRTGEGACRLTIAFKLAFAALTVLLCGRTRLNLPTVKPKLAIALGLLMLIPSLSVGQATVNFNNRVLSAGIDAPVTDNVTSLRAYGDSYLAQLYYAPTSMPEALTPIGAIVDFQIGTASGYLNVGSEGSRNLPGIAFGQPVVLQIRAWDTASGASYEESLANVSGRSGFSEPITLTTGPQFFPPVNMTGLQPFSLSHTLIPEPPAAALLMLGVVVLLLVGGKWHKWN